MAFWLMIASVVFAFSAGAAAPLHQKLQLESVPCGPQALKMLQQWDALDEWRMKFTEDEEDRKFQGPTREFGKWIQVEYQNQKNLKLTQFSEKTQLQFQFDMKCEPQIKDLAQDRNRKPANLKQAQQKFFHQIPSLNDSEISKILKKKTAAVFFL